MQTPHYVERSVISPQIEIGTLWFIKKISVQAQVWKGFGKSYQPGYLESLHGAEPPRQLRYLDYTKENGTGPRV